MQINFTKKQYETLLKLIEYGQWITSSQEVVGEDYNEMEQYILSYAKEFHFEGVRFNKESQVYDLMAESKKEMDQVINEYEDMVFWDKLAYYLARRDFSKESSNKEYSQEEVFQRLLELEDKYHIHFENHGLRYVKIEE